LAAGLSFEETVRQASNEVRAAWYGQEPMPALRDDIDWLQLGEAFMIELLDRGHEVGR